MASQTLQHRFSVAAPPERVWTYLTTPELVVTCLPGAALLSSSEDGRTHEGTVTVKLGAISVAYRGTAEFVALDGDRRRLGVTAKGREKTGSGSAQMTMQADVIPAEEGCHVELDATVSVTGKIVTLGRGMIGIVSEQVISEFALCLSERLGSERPGDESDAAAEGAADDAFADAAAAEERPVEGLSLLMRALRSWLSRLFGRS